MKIPHEWPEAKRLAKWLRTKGIPARVCRPTETGQAVPDDLIREFEAQEKGRQGRPGLDGVPGKSTVIAAAVTTAQHKWLMSQPQNLSRTLRDIIDKEMKK